MEVPQLQFLELVDVFFVQFIDGVDVPVIMQRRGLLSVIEKVVDMPVVFNDRCLGLSVQKTAESAVAVLTIWSMSLFVQVVVWVSCLRCLKINSSPEFVDFPVCTETGSFQRGFGGDVGLGIFRAPPGRPGVERQFSEPLMTKSSLLSRAPAT